MILEIRDKKSVARIRDVLIWTLGRIGQRNPLYGPLNTVVPSELIESWLEAILDSEEPGRNVFFAVMMMARKTGDRYRDIGESMRDRVLSWMESRQAPDSCLLQIREGGRLDSEVQSQAFGEALPPGLRLA